MKRKAEDVEAASGGSEAAGTVTQNVPGKVRLVMISSLGVRGGGKTGVLCFKLCALKLRIFYLIELKVSL